MAHKALNPRVFPLTFVPLESSKRKFGTKKLIDPNSRKNVTKKLKKVLKGSFMPRVKKEGTQKRFDDRR